jgi:hypothetical protein
MSGITYFCEFKEKSDSAVRFYNLCIEPFHGQFDFR